MANLEALELPGIPKRQNCLAWSEDGELAIALGDQIFILVVYGTTTKSCYADSFQSPSQTSKQIKPDETTWHRTQFTAGTFTLGEWPETVPETMLNMCTPFIGREQAPAEVVSIQWSSPGIAPRFRCALAVLTTNYLLSLWTIDPESSLETKWTRQCIINACISRDLSPIVAMGWSPIVDGNKLRKNKQAVRSYREPLAWKYYLAVILEDMTLTIICVTPPHRSQRFGTVSVCASARFPDSAIAEREKRELCYDSLVHSEAPLLGTLLHGVDWCPWKYNPGSPHVKSTIVARAYNEDVRWPISTELEGNVKIGKPSNLKIEADVRSVNGTDSVWNGPCMVSPLKPLQNSGDETEYICLTTQEYTLECYRLVHEKRGKMRMPSWEPCVGSSRLDEQVKKLTQEYSERLHLQGPVDVRVWGLVSLGAYVALCLTLHPARLLQYITPANKNFHILFSHSSMEAISFANTAEDWSMRSLPWMVSDTMTSKNDFEARSGPLPPNIPPVTHEVNTFRMNVQLTLTILISSLLHQNPVTSWIVHMDAVLATYASTQIASWPGLTDLLASIRSARKRPADQLNSTVLTKLVNEFIQKRAAREVSDSTLPHAIEYCPMPGCGSAVFWSAACGASCARGHRQTRCALTALALLDPYVIKRCSTCARAYLDETRLDAFYKDAGLAPMQQAQPPPSKDKSGDAKKEEDAVAWLLQAVTCIYCGGKFTRYV